MKYLIPIVALLLALSVSSARACNTAQLAFFTSDVVVSQPSVVVSQPAVFFQPQAFVFQTQPAFFFQPSFGFNSVGFNSFAFNGRRARGSAVQVNVAGGNVRVRHGLFGGTTVRIR